MERWDDIDRVLQSALERAPGERRAFVEEACAGDEELRRGVLSVLDSYERAGSFMGSPAVALGARVLGAQRELGEGDSVGQYRIVRLLGRGGMGEVYLAEDTKLGRTVALKILPAEFAADRQRMRRFEQEAKTASALNHPNILTIFEIGEAGSLRFIATEYIDGVTLRRRLSGGRVKLQEVLDIATQVAAALDAAHEAGVVHRDIKPENVMVRRRDHIVKVLDFGLAKLTAKTHAAGNAPATDPEAPTQALVHTEPGLVMGTVVYMSPEQSRGLRVDARTDIWALGVVLYEMLAGRLPFDGADVHRQVIAIQEQEPPLLNSFAEGVPEELQRIVSKALAKDLDERYQTAKDLLIDLRNLRKRLEVEAEIERSLSPERKGTGAGGGSEGRQPARVGTAEQEAQTAVLGRAQTRPGVSSIAGAMKRHKRGVVIALAAAIVAAAGVILAVKYLGRNQPAGRAAPFSKIRMTRLTATGKANYPGISPDGKYVVYTTGERGHEGVWLKHVPTGSDKEIVAPGGVSYCCSFFSADGDYIYYAKRASNVPSVMYQAPVLGGVTRAIGEDLDCPPTFSPDGRRMAFLRGSPPEGVAALVVSNADGTGQQRLAAFDINILSNSYPLGPAWSPDGEVIVVPVKASDADGIYWRMLAVRVKDGTATQVGPQRWSSLAQFAWLRDGSGLLFTGSDQPPGIPMQIWHVSYPEGSARKVTNDVSDYRWVRLTADSRAFVTTSIEQFSNLWVAPGADAARAARVTSNKYDGLDGVAFAPDGRLVYTSSAGGVGTNIWVVNPDGTGQKQLMADPSGNFTPVVSPDGRYVIFVSDRAGAQNIWRMDSDGRNPTRLTYGERDRVPHCSPDGRWVIYVATDSGKQRVARVPIEGGDPVLLTDYSSAGPVVSPDGKQIACGYFDEKLHAWKVAVIPFEGGRPVKTFDINVWPIKLRWVPDGRALTYVQTRAGVSNIWGQPIGGGPPAQLTDFKTDLIIFFDWSRDGKQLVLARGGATSDVVLISDAD